jgi:cytochrome P450
LNFFLEMIRHPDVQAKAQEEIDRVIGRDRLPVIQDRESLPYVRSIITEVLRMNPALPLGVFIHISLGSAVNIRTIAIPHALNQDDVYEGMYLPKDSTIVANIWYVVIIMCIKSFIIPPFLRMMLHDPDVFMNPMEFDPARYLNSDSEMAKVTEVVFGFGRRVCPGKLFGEATLFAVVATTLATCNILPPVDAGGNKVAPSVTFSGGTFRHVIFIFEAVFQLIKKILALLPSLIS